MIHSHENKSHLGQKNEHRNEWSENGIGEIVDRKLQVHAEMGKSYGQNLWKYRWWFLVFSLMFSLSFGLMFSFYT